MDLEVTKAGIAPGGRAWAIVDIPDQYGQPQRSIRIPNLDRTPFKGLYEKPVEGPFDIEELQTAVYVEQEGPQLFNAVLLFIYFLYDAGNSDIYPKGGDKNTWWWWWFSLHRTQVQHEPGRMWSGKRGTAVAVAEKALKQPPPPMLSMPVFLERGLSEKVLRKKVFLDAEYDLRGLR